MTFGQRLQALRRAKGMTQEDIASKSGMSLGAIRDYEQGKRDPRLSNAQQLADALGIDLNELAAGTGPAPKKKSTRRKKR